MGVRFRLSNRLTRTDMEVPQVEKAFQKQAAVVYNNKKGSANKKKYVRQVGLGFKVPREAREGAYVDKKCPFTGDVLHFIKKYGRFEKRHTNMAVHLSPCFRDVELGDLVTVGECRPLSKTVRFNVVKHSKPPGAKKQFSKF